MKKIMISTILLSAIAQGSLANTSTHNLPGMVEAEDYSGFWDASPGNAGGVYRDDDVDIEISGDTGGGYNVGWVEPGEWLDYSVNVSDAGRYILHARVGALLEGSTFSVQLDGETLGDVITVPSTGAWQQYATISHDLGFLSEGLHDLRIQSQDNGKVNFNWFNFEKLSDSIAHVGGAPTSIPATKAQQFDIRWTTTEPRDLIVSIFDNNWKWLGGEKIIINKAGDGTSNFQFNLPNAPVAGTNYQLKIESRPAGGAWNTQGVIANTYAVKAKAKPGSENPGTGEPGTGEPGCQENEGLVILEAEHALNDLGLWRLKNSIANYKGDGHIEFTGNGSNGGPASSPIRYDFTVTKSGNYRMIMRAHKRLDGQPWDKNNDAYVRLEGDFSSPIATTPVSVLKRDTKMFGGAAVGWGWAEQLEKSYHKFAPATYALKAGETYSFVISGRSINFNIDRIIFFNTAQYSMAQAKATQHITHHCGDPAKPELPEQPEQPELPEQPAYTPAKPGDFDIAKDLLLCNYDGIPDEDDLHSVAGLATMLKMPALRGVNYHCTAGAYGTQKGAFLDEPYLFDLAFGPENWANADNNQHAAAQIAFNKVRPVLAAGGDIWVAEAGQSDVTAKIVRLVKANMPTINTRNRIHVVQHSEWNQDKATVTDLNYLRRETDYHKIDDGNSNLNNTPGLTTRDNKYWARAKSDPEVGAIWAEAEVAALRWMGVNWDNDKIAGGGMDFSDTVEAMWIFGYQGQKGGVKAFFDAFL